MSVYNWLSLFGIPAVLSGLVGYVVSQLHSQKTRSKALELGVQALLRDRLLQSFRHYSAQGHINFAERENWLNLFNQYHSLGANGVMDEYKNRLMDMPIGDDDL